MLGGSARYKQLARKNLYRLIILTEPGVHTRMMPDPGPSPHQGGRVADRIATQKSKSVL